MMVRPIFLFLILYFRSVYCKNGDLPKNIVIDESVDNITKLCNEKKCIPKCCDRNEVMFTGDQIPLCFMNTNITDKVTPDMLNGYLTNIPLHDNYYHDKKVNKILRDVFFLVPRKFNDTIIYSNEECNFVEVGFIIKLVGCNEYLSESGKLYMECPNSYERWTAIENSNFCVDVDSETMTAQFFAVQDVIISEGNDIYNAIASTISSVFLFLILLVYMVLPELRNLAGLVLMAYVFSFLIALISLACIKTKEYDEQECINMTGLCYFFVLSSFCWMNVMSFDIWWTFRGYAKCNKIHRRGEHFKFVMYCIYAWGVPMIMTIGLLEMNNMDLSHTPWIIKPQIPKLGCFLQGGQKFVYLYIPILILIICNWVFFLMTAFNIWRLVRGTKVLNSEHSSQKNRLGVYLKLSVIMGTSWLLEVLSFLTPQFWYIWQYTDLYNLLIGIFMFIIFVCKPNIYRKLKARFIASPIIKKNMSPQRRQRTEKKAGSTNIVNTFYKS